MVSRRLLQPDPLAWVLQRLGRVLRQSGLVYGLLLSLTVIFGNSIDRAGWVRDSQAWDGLLLALVFGAALARSRFSGRFAAAYGLMLLVVGAARQVGRVLPPADLLAQSPNDWAWTLSLRTLTLLHRVGGWWLTIRSGGVVQDTGLFVWIFSMLVWAASGWLAWWVLRRHQALAAVLPAGVILAANMHLSGQSWFGLWLYVVLAVLLVAYTNFVRQHAEWDRRGIDYPGELGLEWSGATLGVMAVVALLAAVAPLVTTPHGWRLLADLVDTSREQAAETASQLFAGVTPPRGAVAVSVITPDLGVIGAPIDQSPDTIMWVRLSDPVPIPVEAGRVVAQPPQHYWRSGLYATYTGSGWQPVAPPETPPPDAAWQAAPAGRYSLRQEFEIVAAHGSGALFAVNLPVTASAGARVDYSPVDATGLVKGRASTYTVWSWATRATEAELRTAPADYPPELAAAYLQLPPELPDRVRDLAAEITRGAATHYDRAVRLQNYLRDNYAYTLDLPPPRAGQDAVDYFLYEAPGGFCTYYASAMAVMLRTQGVAARVATGYAMGDFDFERGAYRVPGNAAHAWVEVYFSGYGWVEFEPTGIQRVFEREAGQVDAVVTPVPPETPNGAVALGWGWRIGLIGLVVVLAAVWFWQLIGAPAGGNNPRGRTLRLYRHLRRALAGAGLRGGPSMTPDEYLAASRPALAGRATRLQAAMDQATALYRRAAYSQHPVSGAEVEAVEQLWAQARWDWIRLLLRRLW